MRTFAQKLIAWHRKLLVVVAVLFALEVILLFASPRPTQKQSIVYALETPAACLMTLSSPAEIAIDGRLGYAPRGVAWLLSLCGWLLVPAVIGYVVSMRQGEEASALGIAHEIELEAIRRKITPASARAYAKVLFDAMENYKKDE